MIMKERKVKIAILIPIVVIKVIDIVIVQVVAVEEMNMANVFWVTAGIVILMKMKRVGDQILHYLLKIMVTDEIIHEKLDRLGNL